MVRGLKVGNVVQVDWRFRRALIALDLSLRVGDEIQIVGPETDSRQTVTAMEYMREKVTRGKPAQKVWIPLVERARPGDAVVIMPPSEESEEPAGE